MKSIILFCRSHYSPGGDTDWRC